MNRHDNRGTGPLPSPSGMKPLASSGERRRARALGAYSETSEKAIESYLNRRVKAAGGVSLKFASATQTGYPDRILLFPPGRCFWVEIKSQGKHPTPLQCVRINALRELGHTVWICDSRQKVDEVICAILKYDAP